MKQLKYPSIPVEIVNELHRRCLLNEKGRLLTKIVHFTGNKYYILKTVPIV